MNTDHGGIFEDLEPPAGGAERFRQRLEAADHSRVWPMRPLLAAGVAVVALVIAAAVVLWQGEGVEPRTADEPQIGTEPEVVDVLDSKEFDRLLGRPFEPVETRVAIDDMPVALTEVPGTRPGIRIYEVRTN